MANEPSQTMLLTSAQAHQSLQKLYQNWLVLQSSTATIWEQPDFNLSLLPTLPEDQGVLRQHVADYRADVSKQILDVYQTFITLGSLFEHYGQNLVGLARKLDNGDAASLKPFDDILSALERDATSPNASVPSSIYNRINGVKNALDLFYNEKTEDDNARFQTALKEAKYFGPIEKLKAEITSLQEQITAANDEIAQGATSEIPEALEFGFSMGEAVTAELPAGIVAVNVAIKISTAAQKGSKSAQEWKERYDKLNQLTEKYVNTLIELAGDEQQMAVLETLAAQVGTFSTKLTTARNHLSSLTSALSTLKDNFGELIEMDASPSAKYFENQISTAVEFWSKLGKDCQKYLASARSA